MNSDNITNDSEVPLGLGMAFAQNMDAMRYFSALSEPARQEVIRKAHSVRSKQEMQAFVASLGRETME